MIDFLKLPSPCYVLDETLLDANLALIDRVRRESGAEIIVALKACAMWSIFPRTGAPLRRSDGEFRGRGPARLRRVRPIGPYLCPGLYRPQLRRDPALQRPHHLQLPPPVRTLRTAGPDQRHLVRSADQPGLFARRDRPLQPVRRRLASGHHTRTAARAPEGIEGLHFHVLCESRPEHLRLALEAVEQRFGHLLDRVKWLNMGGRPPDDARRLRLR